MQTIRFKFTKEELCELIAGKSISERRKIFRDGEDFEEVLMIYEMADEQCK